MSKINYNLNLIRGLAFDVDGVLSPSTIPMSSDGVPQRMVNIKDGFVLQLAARLGYKICIITGADSEAVRVRFNGLGIKDVFTKAAHKLPIFEEWMAVNGLTPEETVYAGDDVPDIICMRHAGLGVAPSDASVDALEAADYITPCRGGEGVARDLLEQILRAQGCWLTDASAFGW